MATKRPLQQLEEMVTALPPTPTEKKSKKERKIKIKKPPQVDPSSPPRVPSTPTTTTLSPPPPVPPPPPPPLINMDDLFNGDNILNLLNPPAASYEVQLPPMEQACQSVVCPMHQTDLTCFQAQTTGDTYIKCQEKKCGLFCHQDQIATYLKIINEKLHPDYLKRTLVCDCEEPVLLRISRSQANPNRPYFTCKETPEDRCPFFQWADKPLKPKNRKKQRQDTTK